MEGLEIRVPERTRAQWRRQLGEMFAGLPAGYVEAVVHSHDSYEGACEALVLEAKRREDAKLARLCDRFPDAALTEVSERREAMAQRRACREAAVLLASSLKPGEQICFVFFFLVLCSVRVRACVWTLV